MSHGTQKDVIPHQRRNQVCCSFGLKHAFLSLPDLIGISVCGDIGTVWTWGDNTAGQTGHPGMKHVSKPTRLSGACALIAVNRLFADIFVYKFASFTVANPPLLTLTVLFYFPLFSCFDK
jgi:hypothetical protein